MDKISLLDLIHVGAWVLFGIAPLYYITQTKIPDRDGEDFSGFFIFISVALQAAVIVGAYIAGIRVYR
jgi:hypothetical protein